MSALGDLWNDAFLGNPTARWATAVGVAVAALVAVRAVVALAVRRLRPWAERTVSGVDDLVAELLGRTRSFFYLFVGVYLGSLVLELPPDAEAVLRSAVVLALLLQGALWANAGIDFAIRRARERQLETDPAAATTLGALGFVGRLILWSVVALLALDNLGVDVTTLVAGLGVGGIAIALAVQNVLGDLFASLSIVLDKPFVVGDFIIVGDLMGTVEYVGLKTTRVRSLSGEQLVFANSDLLGSRIRNYKRMSERRILFSFGVVYGTPYEQVEAIPGIVREIIEGLDDTRFDRAHFKEYGDSALVFEVVYYMLVPDYNAYMDVQQAINLALLRRFRADGIEFAYPTRTLRVTMDGGDAPEPEVETEREGGTP